MFDEMAKLQRRRNLNRAFLLGCFCRKALNSNLVFFVLSSLAFVLFTQLPFASQNNRFGSGPEKL